MSAAIAAAIALPSLLSACTAEPATPTLGPEAISFPPSTEPAPTTTAAFPVLTDGQRAFCRFTSSTDQDAFRFDLIFEAGLQLGLNMDVVNAIAGGSRRAYEQQGMSPDEAIRATSEDLFENLTFVKACIEAFDQYGPGR